ncbi:MAG: 2-isopropylmalate synthase [Proteobacteria bacterium]|nr:2-isopropylmalate synthase [Pseudomonadota bacterium]
MENKKVRIFDTTLRDGQQCPGAGMSFEQNLEYTQLAMEVGVDVLEAGFPSASHLDFEIVNTIAKLYGCKENSPIIAGLCQLREEQIDTTIEALLPAVKFKKAMLHVYLPVGIHLMPASLGERADDKQGLIKDVYNFIKKAADAGMEVEYSPEGYSQMGENFDFVTDTIRAAVEAGAYVINCPDTTGGACSFQKNNYFVDDMKKHAAIIAKEYPGRDVIWSVHCHNDFGLATQNSINGVFQGPARQIEGCFNGVGERAGNVSLEQCIMIIKHFAKELDDKNPFYTTINTEKIAKISDYIAKNMLPRQPHFPITGYNATRHSSGGHTNAILRNPLAYQPFDPKEVGKEIGIVFGPLSGGNHARSIIERCGYVCTEEEKAEVAQHIKDLYSQRRKGITDDELIRGYLDYRAPIKIEAFDYSKTAQTSEVKLKGKFFTFKGDVREVHEGKDSALAALKKIIDKYFGPVEVQSHRSKSDTSGITAVSVSKITIADELGAVYEGSGADQDIEISAMKALVDAVNKAYIERNYRKKN